MNTSKAVRTFLKRMNQKKRIEIANQIHMVISRLSIIVFYFRNGDIELSELRKEFQYWFLYALNNLTKGD